VSAQEIPPPLQRVLDKIEASGRVVKRTGRQQYIAQCVSHDDDNPSLSIGWGAKNAVVFHCQSGCERNEVLAALGMKWSDLQMSTEVDAVYPYNDEDGELVYEVVRYRPKSFRQRRPNPADPRKRIWDMKGVEPIPFRLPELAEQVAHGNDEAEIWITEGEKDALAMVAAYGDVTVTCNSGGAGKWTDIHSAHLIGFRGNVIIVADRDKAGRKHALAVHDSLLAVTSITAEVVHSAVGKDAADHVGDFGLDDFQTVSIAEMIEDTNADDSETESAFDAAVSAELDRISVREAARREHAKRQASGLFPGFTKAPLREVLAEPRAPVPWLIEGLQRAGHKATLVAQYKTGKTTFSANVVRSMADGVPLLGRFDVHELSGNVGVFDYELSEDDALDMYRTMGMQHDDRVYLQSLRGTGFTLANDTHCEMSVAWLRDHDVEYWVLDPFGRAMRGFGEENSNDDVRAFLMRLDTVAKEAGLLGVLLPVHTGRAAAEPGSERARGATVIDDDPDVRWLLTRDASGRRFFRAEGRAGVSVNEVALEFDPGLLRLSATDMTRSEAAGEKFTGPVLNYIENNPGATTSQIKKDVSGTDAQIAAAISLLVKQHAVRREQDGRAHRHHVERTNPERLRLRATDNADE
jgi:hypothetical protein